MTDREDRTRECAYRIWEEQGRPEGRALEHWHEAERQLHQDPDVEGILERDVARSKAPRVTAKSPAGKPASQRAATRRSTPGTPADATDNAAKIDQDE